MITLADPADLTPEVYRRVIHEGETLALAPALLDRIDAARATFLALLDAGALCYGVNTGFGALHGERIETRDWAELQRNVLRARAAATGAPFSPPVARGMMLARLVNFLSGHAAASAALCRFIVDRLNDGFTPWVPARGLGMAGEIIPLCHMAQTFVGEGFVIGDDGARIPAAEALAARGVAPYVPGAKEGLALINGVAASPAYGFEAARALGRTARLLILVAAASVEAMAAPLEPYDPAVDRLRPQPGIAEAARRLRRHLAGSAIPRGAAQAAISLRVTPQVMGALLDALAGFEAVLAEELASISDNPVFVAGNGDGPARILHTGSFHNAHLALAADGLAVALASAGALSVRRLHRLLDARHSGLAPQLALRPGMDAGLVILHKAALGHEARLRLLAAPVTLNQAEASFGQEDAMTMIFPALDRLFEMAEIARMIAAYELYAALVAIDQRGERPGADVATLRALVRARVAPYAGDRAYGPEIEIVAALFDDPAFAELTACGRA